MHYQLIDEINRPQYPSVTTIRATSSWNMISADKGLGFVWVAGSPLSTRATVKTRRLHQLSPAAIAKTEE